MRQCLLVTSLLLILPTVAGLCSEALGSEGLGSEALGFEGLIRCRLADGSLLYSDLPCPADAERLSTQAPGRAPAPASFVDGGLDAADRDHLRRIDARRAERRAGTLFGLPATDQVDACRHARERLSRHRTAARRLHRGSLLALGRQLRAEVRAHCD